MTINPKKVFLLFFLCCNTCFLYAQTHIISGTVTDSKSGEMLQGATISSVTKENTITNAYGYFSMVLAAGIDTITISRLGYGFVKTEVDLRNTDVQMGKINLAIENAKSLETVMVKAQRGSLRRNVQSTQMGIVDIPVSLLIKVPSIAGEPDIIKALQLTPGVKRGGEGTIGMFIRGGGIDENLVLLDEATVYNAGHLLGFFSVFNTNALKDVQLYKSSFPAQYSGRLSGILDVRMKEGNMQKFEGDASIGLISSNITLQGPLKKNKSSFIVSARRTYLDKVTGGSVPYHFYDVNFKVNQILNKNNRIFFSLYKGDDVFNIVSASGNSNLSTSSPGLRSGLKLGNAVGSLRWNHIFKDPRMFSNVSLIYTKFRYNIEAKYDNNSLLISSRVQDIGGRADLSYKPNSRHSLVFGGQYILHKFQPNIVNTTGLISGALQNSTGRKISNAESGVYVSDEWKVNDKILLNTGLRLTLDAAENKTYFFPEPRISGRYLLDNKNSIKFSYARMVQNMHLVSSSSLALPTDLWYPVTDKIKPSTSDQVSVGYYRNFPEKNIGFSVETYYKWRNNLIEYKEGASLMLNNNYENELVTGNGNSYGVELFASKSVGRLQGWAGYTLSYALQKFDSLNFGKQFYSRFDRRHDASLVVSYELSKRWSFSGNYVYSSGSPFTAQVSQFIAPTPTFTNIDILPVYSSRNAIRLSGAQRIDVDFVLRSKASRKRKTELHIGCYNILNAAQPGRVTREFNDQTGKFEYLQRGLFGRIGSVSYNIHF